MKQFGDLEEKQPPKADLTPGYPTHQQPTLAPILHPKSTK